ncbi:hypothetical protein [Reticulibacter mediterranei]|nr:hypothetical protein [Reticulibacter mediterranei]
MKIKHIYLYFSTLALGVFLAVLMTGCSGTTTLPAPSQETPSATNATPTTASAMTATPTTAPAGTTPTTNIQTYTCDLFQVSYSDPWEVSIGRSNQVQLGGGNKKNFDIIAQSDTSKTAEQELAAILLVLNDENTHFQTIDVQPAMTIGGQSWRQVTWTGKNKSSGLDFKGREAVINYNGHQYRMSYSSLTSDFSQEDTHSFQVMQQSFAFKTAA